MSTLNEFISAIKSTGLARSNRFSVNIPFPVAADTDPRQVLILCDSASLPGVTIGTAQQRFWGELREIPYEALYDNVELSFYVDTNLGVKNLFEKWLGLIRNPETRTFNYYANYITDIDIYIHPIDNSEDSVHVVTLHEAYPKILKPVSLDYGNKDVMKYSVSMNYKWFTTSFMSRSEATSLLGNIVNDPLGSVTGDIPITTTGNVGGVF